MRGRGYGLQDECLGTAGDHCLVILLVKEDHFEYESLTITIMISILVVGGIGILGCQQRAAFVMIRVEDIVVREFGFIVVQSPYVQENCCAFGQEFAFNPFV